jgi:hypothetical protein
MFRGLCAVILAQGMHEQVLARVDPATRAMMLDPPPATTWIDAHRLMDVDQVLLELRGAAVLRQMTRRAAEEGMLPVLRGTVEGLLRLFGASPASLFSRVGRFAGSTARGIEYRYIVTSETSGLLELEHVGLTNVPRGPLVATAGGLEYIFELCGVRGTISDPEMVDNGRANICRYQVAWRPRR